MTARAAEIRRFIGWAQAHLPGLHGAAADVVADEVCEHLLTIDRQLGVEVDEPVDGDRALTITAFSDPRRVLLVHRIVAALSAIEGWHVVALKQPTGFACSIEHAATVIDAAALRFEPIAGLHGGFRLLVPAGLPVPDGADGEELAWLIVESGIGEELAARIQHLEFGAMPGVGVVSPIASLDAYVRALSSSMHD